MPEIKNLRVELKRMSYDLPREGSFSPFVLIKESKKISTSGGILKVVSFNNIYHQRRNIFYYVTSNATM